MEQGIVRKDLKNLKTWEYERFWACLIYLNILPPVQKHSETNQLLRKTQVYYKPNEFRVYEPLNRYDEYISSHASVCEHMTNYFGHYHRHLFVLVQLALNQADKSLRNREVPQRFDNTEYRPLFEAVFDRYAQIIAGCTQQCTLGWVAMHYWNPLNYNHRIEFPQMLKPEEKENRKTDPFWILHKQYLQCDFGQRNFKYTWNNNQDFTTDSAWNQPGAIYPGQSKQCYNPTETTILEGNFVRENPIHIQKMPDFKDKFYVNKTFETFETIYADSKVHLHILSQQQLNIQYGGQKYRWYRDQELKDIPILTPYNKEVGHYSYAQSLQIPFENFCTHLEYPEGDDDYISTVQNFLIRFQDSHNIMHNYLAFTMRDDSFSIANPLFMVYHSYIDFMLEVQIRRANEDLSKAAYNSMVAFTETEFNLNENEKRITRTDEVKTLLQAFTISNHLSTFYEYPLLEWLDTKQIITAKESEEEGIPETTEFIQNANYQSCDTYGNYYFHNDKIREVTQLQQFYTLTKYGNKVENYPFNYTYDILPTDASGDDLIPDYIRVIIDEDTRQNGLFAGRVALREKSVNGPILEKGDDQSLKAIFRNKGEGVSSLKIEKIKSLSVSFNKKVKRFNKLYAFISYPSSTSNQNVRLSFKIKDINNFSFRNCNALTTDFEKKARNSNGVVPALSYPIFVKGLKAKGCPRCTSHKTVVKNIFNYLNGYFYPFYIDLIVNSNFGTVYNSKNPANVEKSFNELVEFSHTCSNKAFRFECLEGASAVKFRSKFVKNIDDEKSEEIMGSAKINLVGFIYEVKSSKEFIYVEQKGCGQNCDFHFTHIADSTSVEDKAIYLYRDFNCSVKNQNGQERKFSFSLKNFQSNAVYDILIDADNNVAVRDANILEKREYLW